MKKFNDYKEKENWWDDVFFTGNDENFREQKIYQKPIKTDLPKKKNVWKSVKNIALVTACFESGLFLLNYMNNGYFNITTFVLSILWIIWFIISSIFYYNVKYEKNIIQHFFEINKTKKENEKTIKENILKDWKNLVEEYNEKRC